MAEEHAWLVRAHSDSESSKLGSFGSLARTMMHEDIPPEGAGDAGIAAANAPSPQEEHSGADGGELIDYNDASALEQFHEDALRQAGCGLAQARVLLASGLAVGGASLELSAIPFVLPSAEIELCILPHEKNWLVMISLMGLSLGAVGWGALSARVGRRRALVSSLAVNAVFASIAAFMPTYGTFMMARFCSAIGSGGIVPTCYTYSGEMMLRHIRSRALAILIAAAGVGVLASAALARAVLPLTGADALVENKEHFSAWHRYLLLCTLPILASLVSLIWSQESPRCLLELGREVDAMVTYQSMHTSNQVRMCGKGNEVATNTTDAEYRLGELSLPGKRRPPALHHVRHSVKLFWQAFFQLFSSSYRRTTLSLGGTLLFAVLIQIYLSAYIPASVVNMENAMFAASKRNVSNITFNNMHYNQTFENVDYDAVAFHNCTFRDMLMSHVQFRNCTFIDVSFSNIKTSYTEFKGSVFVNSTIIDTDIEMGRELDAWCVINGTVIRGMKDGCARHADLTSRLGGLIAEQGYAAHAMLVGGLLGGLLPPSIIAKRDVILCGICILLSPAVYAAQSETALYIVEAVYRLMIWVIYFGIAVSIVDVYPANLRCTAHGLMLSIAYMFGVLAFACGTAGAVLSSVIVALLAGAATLTARAR